MKPTQHNKHKQRPSKTKPRPIDRNHPICWLDSSGHLLNYISWPGFFFEYIEKAFKIDKNNVVANVIMDKNSAIWSTQTEDRAIKCPNNYSMNNTT